MQTPPLESILLSRLFISFARSEVTAVLLVNNATTSADRVQRTFLINE